MRVTVIAALVLAFTLASGRAGAAMMEHHDLTSLVLMSDAVVLARKTGERAIDPYRTATIHRVLRVYRGALRPDDTIEVEYGAYSMVPLWGWRKDAGTPLVSDDVILFLHRGSVYLPDGGSQQAWQLVPSGLRIFADGAAYRFEQFNNPGPYEPVPQGLDPYDLLADPRGNVSLDLRAFEAVLGRALVRADAVKDAIAKVQTNDQALLDLIGPAPGVDDGSPCALNLHDFYQDQASASLLEALAGAHRLDAFVQGFARTSSPIATFRLRHPFTAAELLAVAADSKRALADRVAALELARGNPFNRAKPSDDKSVIALLGDPEAEIRARAVYVDFDGTAPPESVRAAIAKRWAAEHEARVLYALIDHAPRPGANELAKHAAEMPAVWASRKRRSFIASWAWLDPKDQVSIRALGVEVRAKDRVAKKLSLYPSAAAGTWSGASTAGIDGYLDLDGLETGAYELVAEIELENTAHRVTTRRIALGRYMAKPTPPVEVPASSAAPAAASAPAAPAPTVAPAARPKSCACEIAPDTAPWTAAIALLALGAVFARRVTR